MLDFVPDPLEFWEYASDEQIEAAILADREGYEEYCKRRDEKEALDK